MSPDDDTGGWAVPVPAFDPTAALVGLKRELRALRPLAERGAGFEIRGQRVIELAADAAQIDAKLARRPARQTEWTAHPLRSAPDLRRFVERVKKQLPQWERDE